MDISSAIQRSVPVNMKMSPSEFTGLLPAKPKVNIMTLTVVNAPSEAVTSGTSGYNSIKPNSRLL